MPKFDDFKKKLEKTDSEEHSALLRHVKGLVDISRGDMSKNFSAWDEHDRVFRAKKKVDREDQNAEQLGKPKKVTVPLTYSQIMTFVAFSVQSVTQNRRFFELEPTGTEDNPLTEPMELILERDLRRNQWNAFLIEYFLDIGRFGIASAEVCYEEEYRWMRVKKTEQVDGPFGEQQTNETNDYQQIPVFIGNRVYGISPYRFLPDTRQPLRLYQRGEFCGSEDVFSFSQLVGQTNIFNTDKIPKFTEDGYKKRTAVSRVDLGGFDARTNPNLGATGSGADSTHDNNNMVTSGPVTITKMVFDLNPTKFKVGDKDEKPLGDEDHPIRYLCWIANDKTIVRFEEAYFVHGMFPYICSQYLPDKHQIINEGLADVCEQLTSLVTWKLNAHVLSQRNSLDGKMVIDPYGINTSKLDARSPYIFLNKAAAGTDVNRYVKEIATVDTTANVMKDVDDLDKLLQEISGWSAQMQGQYSSGRRSATQDRVVAQGAGARGKTTLSGVWDTSFEPLGKQLIANNRLEMDLETFKRIMGQRTWPQKPVDPTVQPQIDPQTGQPVPPPNYTTEEIFQMFQADPVAIAMSEDFFVFDGTLPSEKAFLAQSLQEILMQILQNPTFASVLGFGVEQIRELFNQIYLLRGVTPARLPSTTTAIPIVDPSQQNTDREPTPKELINLSVKDLAGDERKQALAMFGIKADNAAHESRLRLENKTVSTS